jgi:redox-sensitive bicupin YhaK (pirin superfamily)
MHTLLDGRDVPLGRHTIVRRLLPHTNRRMVGAWCFLDHFGPELIADTPGMQVAPHPHCGLQTVTWLVEGEILHRDSLGSLVTIHPGRLNLMTSGHGIAHSEESPEGHGPVMHGLQLWVALPHGEAERAPAFDSHADLPVIPVGDAEATVVMGSFGGVTSPAAVHTPIVGAEIAYARGGSATLPLRTDFEYAVVVMSGAVAVDGVELTPGALLYLGDGRESLDMTATGPVRAFLLGGEPFAEEIVMWWNFVARSHDEIVAARAAWEGPDPARFGVVRGYAGDPLPAPAMPTVRLLPRGREGRPLS